MTPSIIVRFEREALKNKYKRSTAKKHSWQADYYAMISAHSYSETGTAHILLCNDLGELWFVDNRDLRVINAHELSFSEAEIKNPGQHDRGSH